MCDFEREIRGPVKTADEIKAEWAESMKRLAEWSELIKIHRDFEAVRVEKFCDE